MAWAKNGTPETLSGAADTLTISDLTSLTFNMLMGFSIAGTGSPQMQTRFGNSSIDTGNNYAYRRNRDGGADVTAPSDAAISIQNNVGLSTNGFYIGYIINLAAEEKLGVFFNCNQNTAGAGTAPTRQETVGKWVETSNQFNNAQLVNLTGSTDITTDSNISMLGTD